MRIPHTLFAILLFAMLCAFKINPYVLIQSDKKKLFGFRKTFRINDNIAKESRFLQGIVKNIQEAFARKLARKIEDIKKTIKGDNEQQRAIAKTKIELIQEKEIAQNKIIPIYDIDEDTLEKIVNLMEKAAKIKENNVSLGIRREIEQLARKIKFKELYDLILAAHQLNIPKVLNALIYHFVGYIGKKSKFKAYVKEVYDDFPYDIQFEIAKQFFYKYNLPMKAPTDWKDYLEDYQHKKRGGTEVILPGKLYRITAKDLVLDGFLDPSTIQLGHWEPYIEWIKRNKIEEYNIISELYLKYLYDIDKKNVDPFFEYLIRRPQKLTAVKNLPNVRLKKLLLNKLLDFVYNQRLGELFEEKQHIPPYIELLHRTIKKISDRENAKIKSEKTGKETLCFETLLRLTSIRNQFEKMITRFHFYLQHNTLADAVRVHIIVDQFTKQIMDLSNLKNDNLSIERKNISLADTLNAMLYLFDCEYKIKKNIEINLSKNDLKAIPEAIFYTQQIPEKLQALDLSDNKIETLPKALQRLQKIEQIDISNNPIENLPNWLPFWLGKLKNLKGFVMKNLNLNQEDKDLVEGLKRKNIPIIDH